MVGSGGFDVTSERRQKQERTKTVAKTMASTEAAAPATLPPESALAVAAASVSE